MSLVDLQRSFTLEASNQQQVLQFAEWVTSCFKQNQWGECRRDWFVYQSDRNIDCFEKGFRYEKKIGFHKLNVHQLLQIFECSQGAILPQGSDQILDVIYHLKGRVKQHYYSGICGSIRWLFSHAFTCCRFEKSAIVQDFTRLERKFTGFTECEGEQKFRSHLLTLRFPDLIHAAVTVPEKYRVCFQNCLERETEKYFAELYSHQLEREGVLFIPTTEAAKQILLKHYYQALEKILASGKTISINHPFSSYVACVCHQGIKRQSGGEKRNPYLLTGVVNFLKKQSANDWSLYIFEGEHWNDSDFERLEPVLDKIQTLHVRNDKVSQQGLRAFADLLHRLQHQNRPVPKSIFLENSLVDGETLSHFKKICEYSKNGLPAIFINKVQLRVESPLSLPEAPLPYHRFEPREMIPVPSRSQNDIDERKRLDIVVDELKLTSADVRAHLKSLELFLEAIDHGAAHNIPDGFNQMQRFAKVYELIKAKYTPTNQLALSQISLEMIPEYLHAKHQTWLALLV